MATHFICQATEPLPHRFPTTRAPEKSHGAVSQYELLNLSDKAHCQFPPPGWDTSESSEDSLPLYRVPAPAWKTSSKFTGPDPELCVTPEKSLANKILGQKSRAPVPTESIKSTLVDPDLDLTLTPEKVLTIHNTDHKSNLRNGSCEDGKFKGQHRVRFELDNSKVSSDGGEDSFLIPRSGPVKPYKPTSYSDQGIEDLEFKSTFQKNPAQFKLNTVNNRTVYVPLSEKETETKLASHFDDNSKLANHFEDNSTSQETISKEEYVSVIPEVVCSAQSDSKVVCHIQNHKNKQVSKVKSKEILSKKQDPIQQKDKLYIEGDSEPKRKVKVKRETAGQPSDYNYPFSDNSPDSLEYEHVFNRPEYNSTLRIRTELQQIKESEVDVAKALEKKLQLSETKKTEIIEKATAKVNAKETMFSGLVSLEIPVDDLFSQAEQTKTSKIVTSKSVKQKPLPGKHSKEPDLMEFFTADLQKEHAEFSLPGLSAPSEALFTASHITAFDLYRHNRVWDNNSYFNVKKK